MYYIISRKVMSELKKLLISFLCSSANSTKFRAWTWFEKNNKNGLVCLIINYKYQAPPFYLFLVRLQLLCFIIFKYCCYSNTFRKNLFEIQLCKYDSFLAIFFKRIGCYFNQPTINIVIKSTPVDDD